MASPSKTLLSPPTSKKALHHAHVQRLAEAPWAREKVDLAPVVQQIANQTGFIHIIKSLFADLLEILNAYRQLFSLHAPASLRQVVHAIDHRMKQNQSLFCAR